MNLVSLTRFPKIEIRFTYKKKIIILWEEKANNFKDQIKPIKKIFDINDFISIEIYCYKFFINEFYSTIPFFKLI